MRDFIFSRVNPVGSHVGRAMPTAIFAVSNDSISDLSTPGNFAIAAATLDFVTCPIADEETEAMNIAKSKKRFMMLFRTLGPDLYKVDQRFS